MSKKVTFAPATCGVFTEGSFVSSTMLFQLSPSDSQLVTYREATDVAVTRTVERNVDLEEVILSKFGDREMLAGKEKGLELVKMHRICESFFCFCLFFVVVVVVVIVVFLVVCILHFN